MKISFKSIRAKNFLQIGNEFETFDLQKAPFTVIVGKNGSGKSTLCDMITYVLYKKAYRKVNLAQLINSTNKKQMLVEIAFAIGNSSYVVRRGEKPKVFEIYKDKQLVKADPSIGDMQTYLENEILRQNFKTFCQINVIGKSTYKQFLDLTAAERRGVVEDILDSNIYSVMQAIGKSDLKNLLDEVKDVERDIQVVTNNLTNVRNLLKTYEEDRSQQITDLEVLIRGKKLEGDQYAKELKQFDDADLFQFDDAAYKQAQEDLRVLLSESGGYKSALNRNLDIINKIDSLDKCPHCFQVVDANHKTHVVEKSKLENIDIESKLAKINTSITNRQEIISRGDRAKEIIQNNLAERARIQNLFANVKSNIMQYMKSIEKLKEKSDNSNLPNPDDLEVDLNKHIDRKDNLVSKSNKLKEAIKLLGDDGIKAQLISKYIPIINSSVNEYLSRMNMFVEFSLDNEFTESVSAINRENFTYHSFSEGQKLRIDLAILLTWRKISQIKNSMTTNLFILDEMADGSLDDEGMSEFISILKDVADAQNVFVVSHKDSTADLFDNVIRVETYGNFSKYTHE